MTRTSGSVSVGGCVSWRRVIAPALVGVLAALPAARSRAATIPVFRNNNDTSLPSLLAGDQDVDMTVGAPADTISNMPGSGLIPAAPTLLAPWPSAGLTLTSGTGSSKAKGGAGHTEASNLARISFPSGAGLDQVDPNHVLGASRYQVTFNYVWDIPSGTLGPPMTGTFSVPVGAHVGTGPGAYAKFAYDIHWDARINNIAVPDVRSPFIGNLTFTGAGTYVASASAPASSFTPTSIPGGTGNLIVMRGNISFEANNDDSPTVINILGSTLKDVDDILRADPIFINLYNDPSHPEFRTDATSGFEELQITPEPSGALLAAMGAAALLRRRRQARPQ
jgi:hypothetical protein